MTQHHRRPSRPGRSDQILPPASTDAVHQWVGAALVGMGPGDSDRAEHAARTGRHVLPARTRIAVLEVYCERCRVPYSARSCLRPCEPVVARAS